jgi:hypothetical protein
MFVTYKHNFISVFLSSIEKSYFPILRNCKSPIDKFCALCFINTLVYSLTSFVSRCDNCLKHEIHAHCNDRFQHIKEQINIIVEKLE